MVPSCNLFEGLCCGNDVVLKLLCQSTCCNVTCMAPAPTTGLPTTRAKAGDGVLLDQGGGRYGLSTGVNTEGSAQASCLFARCKSEAAACLDDAACFLQLFAYLYDPPATNATAHASPLFASVPVCMDRHCPRRTTPSVNEPGMASAGGDSSTSETNALSAGSAAILVGGVILLIVATGAVALRRRRSRRDLEEHFSASESKINDENLVWDDSDVRSQMRGVASMSLSSLQFDDVDAQPVSQRRANATVRFATPALSKLSSQHTTQSQDPMHGSYELQENNRQHRLADTVTEWRGGDAGTITHFGILSLESPEGTADGELTSGPRTLGKPPAPLPGCRRDPLHAGDKPCARLTGNLLVNRAVADKRRTPLKVRFAEILDDGASSNELRSRQSSSGVPHIVIDAAYDLVGSDT